MAKLHNLRRWVASEKFFCLIMVGFILQAAWIALSGRYPMAFDEDFHLGIIHLYAHHWSPFWSGQPAGAGAFGAVARDPSFLYQYLMSFPDRLITLFTHSQAAEVLILRGLNIALFASALPLFRRLILRTGASRALVHACLLIFILIPVVPLLAAQINYDNLTVPLTALFLVLTIRFSDELIRNKRINLNSLIVLLIVGLFGSVVKYAFIPVFVAVIVFLIMRLRQTYPSRAKLWSNVRSGMSLLTVRVRWLAVIGLVVAVGAFVQRDAVNLVRYHTPVPACDKVLSIQECSAYGPWIRNYTDAQNKTNTTGNPVVFERDWLGGMWLRSVFAVDGPGNDFQTRGPLLLPAVATIFVPAVAVLATIYYGRRLWRRYDHNILSLFALVEIFYLGTLWMDEYIDFVQTGQPVAINGRYLVPVLLPLMVVGALALNEAFKRRTQWKLAVAGVTTLCLLWGGGALTYILRNNDAWLWPNQVVRDANHIVQHVLGPITPGFSNPIAFL